MIRNLFCFHVSSVTPPGTFNLRSPKSVYVIPLHGQRRYLTGRRLLPLFYCAIQILIRKRTRLVPEDIAVTAVPTHAPPPPRYNIHAGGRLNRRLSVRSDAETINHKILSSFEKKKKSNKKCCAYRRPRPARPTDVCPLEQYNTIRLS